MTSRMIIPLVIHPICCLHRYDTRLIDYIFQTCPYTFSYMHFLSFSSLSQVSSSIPHSFQPSLPKSLGYTYNITSKPLLNLIDLRLKLEPSVNIQHKSTSSTAFIKACSSYSSNFYSKTTTTSIQHHIQPSQSSRYSYIVSLAWSLILIFPYVA